MKKFSVLLLAAMLALVCILASCTASDTTSQDPTAEKASEASKETAQKDDEQQAQEPKVVKVMMWYRDNADFQNMEYYKHIEEETGIRPDFDLVSLDDWSTKTNLMFASGDYTDIISHGGVDIEMYGVDQKILLPMDENIEMYMPTYKELLDFDPTMADKMRASDGNMYYTGNMVPQNINTWGTLFINQDWLDNLGMESPTTVEEMEAVLTAIRDGDPNQNGQTDDEIPFSGTIGWDSGGTVQTGVLVNLSFWGIPFNPEWIAIDDDNVVYSQLLEENLRPAMETLHRWYDQGLIDVEAVAQDNTAFEAKVSSGILGTFWRWRMIAMGTDPEIVEQYKGILPVSADGITPKVNQLIELPGFGAALTVACEDVEAACKWLDAQYEFENQMNGYYGEYFEKEGIQYGWRFNDAGKVEFFTADYTQIPNLSAFHFFAGDQYFDIVEMPVQRVEKTTYCKQYTEAGMVEKNSSALLTSIAKPTLQENERKTLLAAEIKKYAEEALVNFITQGVTDEGWEEYLNNLENLKIDEYISIYQAMYDRYLASLK